MKRDKKITTVVIVDDRHFDRLVSWYVEEFGRPDTKIKSAITKAVNINLIDKVIGMHYSVVHNIAKDIEETLNINCDKYLRAGAYHELIRLTINYNENATNTQINNIIN